MTRSPLELPRGGSQVTTAIRRHDRPLPVDVTQSEPGATADGTPSAATRRSVVEHGDAVAAGVLRAVHRGVRAVHEVLDVVPGLHLGHTDAGRHAAGVADPGDGVPEALGEHLAGERHRDVGQDGELVATEPGDGVGLPDGAAEGWPTA